MHPPPLPKFNNERVIQEQGEGYQQPICFKVEKAKYVHQGAIEVSQVQIPKRDN